MTYKYSLGLEYIEGCFVTVLSDFQVVLFDMFHDDFFFGVLALHELFTADLPRGWLRICGVTSDLNNTTLSKTVVFCSSVVMLKF